MAERLIYKEQLIEPQIAGPIATGREFGKMLKHSDPRRLAKTAIISTAVTTALFSLMAVTVTYARAPAHVKPPHSSTLSACAEFAGEIILDKFRQNAADIGSSAKEAAGPGAVIAPMVMLYLLWEGAARRVERRMVRAARAKLKPQEPSGPPGNPAPT
jgi:hypothetical protein